MRFATSALLVFLFSVQAVQAQSNQPGFHNEAVTAPSPRGALLRSLAVPGWGQYYVNNSDWTRGKIHLAADAAMILSYVGLKSRIKTLENTLVTQARSGSGINLKGHSRQVELAVSRFNSLHDYNDFQLATRNWDKVIQDNPQTRWAWRSTDDRYAFQKTRQQIATANNQLPALLSLMVANRVLSGINAFVKARNMQVSPQAALSYFNDFGEPGITARLVVDF